MPLVTTTDDLNQIRNEVMSSQILCLDPEWNITNHLPSRYILGLGIVTDHNEWYIPVSHQQFYKEPEPQNFQIPKDIFKGFTGPIITHNVKNDLQVLEADGILVPRSNLWCTMMMSVYIDENHVPGHDLDTVLDLYVPGERKLTVLKKALMDMGWVTAPPYVMAEYCLQDTRPLPRLFQTLKEKSRQAWLDLWDETDRKFMLLLSEMEMRGIPIDRDLCSTWEAQSLHRLQEIRQELGFDPAKPSQLHPRLFSEPPVGLGLTVPSYTPGQKPQVKLDWLESVGHPVTALVYEYRKTQKQVSSYFTAYLNLTTRDYARLHSDFRQHGTETGRLSCAVPNLQQIPREEYENAYVKKLFLPEPNKQLWEIDFRTIEYRLQALYAKSNRLLELFRAEGDFHQLIADDVSDKAGIKLSRHGAKTLNYAMSFGAGIGVLASMLKIPWKRAKQIHEGYKEALPEVFDRAYEAQAIAEDTMEVDMWFGRTRHFQYHSECKDAFNSAIQGGAFHIVKMAMIKAWEAGVIMSNQVHDSVWINVDNEKEVEEIEHIMTDWTEEFFGLKFSTDRKKLN